MEKIIAAVMERSDVGALVIFLMFVVGAIASYNAGIAWERLRGCAKRRHGAEKNE